MIVKIDSVKEGKVRFDTLTHTVIKIPFIKNKLPENHIPKPTLCFFNKKYHLIVAIFETLINNKIKYEISFLDRRNLTELQEYFSAALDDNDVATVDNLDISSLDEIISLRWLKMPLNKLGTRNYYNVTSLQSGKLVSLDKETFIKHLRQKAKKVSVLEEDRLPEIAETQVDDKSEETIECKEEQKAEICEDKDKDKDTQYYDTYIQVLKLMKQYDSLTIPIKLYKTFRIVDRKTLHMTNDADVRKTMTTIKFDDINNIFAVVECNEQEESTKITILKVYDDIHITDREVEELYVYYRNWVKANSFTIRRR